jgi:hypothetical protein
MSSEEYLSVLVSIVVGLGVSHLLTAIGELVKARRMVRLWWVPLGLAATVFLAQVQWWWSTINSTGHLADNFFGFILFLGSPIVLYLMAVVVLPDFDDLAGPVSLREHHLANHRWVWGLGAALPVLNALRNVLLERAPLWNEDRPFELAGLVVTLSAAVFGGARYQALATATAIVGFLAMIVATSLRPG